METESVQPHPVAGGQDLLLGDHPLIQGKDAYYPALYNLILSVAIAFEYKKNDKILSIQNHLFRFHFFFGAGDLQLLPQRLRELDRRLRNLPGSFDLTDPNQVVDPPTDQCSVISAGLYFQMETVTVTSLIRLNQVNKTTANGGRPAYGTLNYSVSVYFKSLKLKL